MQCQNETLQEVRSEIQCRVETLQKASLWKSNATVKPFKRPLRKCNVQEKPGKWRLCGLDGLLQF